MFYILSCQSLGLDFCLKITLLPSIGRTLTLKFLQVTSQEIHGPCDIIDEALKRYPKRIFPPAAANVYSHLDPLHRKQRRREARREMKTDPMWVTVTVTCIYTWYKWLVSMNVWYKCIDTRVVISAGRNYFSRPGGRNWQKLAETGLNRQKLAEIKNLNLMD